MLFIQALLGLFGQAGSAIAKGASAAAQAAPKVLPAAASKIPAGAGVAAKAIGPTSITGVVPSGGALPAGTGFLAQLSAAGSKLAASAKSNPLMGIAGQLLSHSAGPPIQGGELQEMAGADYSATNQSVYQQIQQKRLQRRQKLNQMLGRG